MRIQIDVRRPRWLRKPTTWKARIAVLGAVALTVGVPVAWASHQFADVPTAHQFHTQIDAIADAGITTGCGGGNYCPNDFVRRDAMAAFMHRGFGRIATSGFSTAVTQTADNASSVVDSLTITPGVPSGALAGANGFFEGHASINIIGPSSGCPCEYWSALFDATESDYLNLFYGRVTVNNSEVGHMSLSGAVPADIVGSHTIQLRVFRFSGSGTGAVASGDFTTSYFPFGSAGGDVLATGAAPQAAGRTP